MNEKGSKRREWVKNAAIVFLAVMLVLTFFSNTIMNYSLPEVAVQYVESGTITAKIRGSGVIESDDPYEVTIDETRKVESVLVKEGAQVQKGDPLFALADQESEELKTAQEALDDALLSFEKEILSGNISNDVIEDVQSGRTTSVAAYQNQIIDADARIENCQNRVDEANTAISQLEAQQSILGSSGTPDTSAEQAKVNEAQSKRDACEYAVAQKLLGEYENTEERVAAEDTIKKYLAYNAVSGGDAENPIKEEDYNKALATQKMYNQLIAEQKAVLDNPDKKNEYDALQKALADAQAALSNKQNSVTNSQSSIGTQLANWRLELSARQAALTEAQEARQQLLTDISSELSLSDQLSDINKMREEIAKLEDKATGAVIEAPISGTISSINVTAGQNTTAGAAIATMLPEGAGFTVSFSVTTEQARRLSPGVEAELVNAWRYDDVKVTLANIRTDPQNPSQNKLLVFNVEGDVNAGQTLNLSVGDRSANYEMIVPNSAIREDNNGKFVLKVESRPTPLSTRYTATRVDVTVIASDDTRSAITGGLYNYDYVITTSDTPVVAGQQIRLADN